MHEVEDENEDDDADNEDGPDERGCPLVVDIIFGRIIAMSPWRKAATARACKASWTEATSTAAGRINWGANVTTALSRAGVAIATCFFREEAATNWIAHVVIVATLVTKILRKAAKPVHRNTAAHWVAHLTKVTEVASASRGA